ncbi:hypothetical protein CPB85DRAFT_1245064 [Mucidula mucida]|nr:hypothetical protein CPB85DRAFT_1245064 [Mucidula mucida]
MFNHNITEFLSIRFAAPPLGPLRWRAPPVPEFSPGITNATVPPPRCLQVSVSAAPAGDLVASEECLFLKSGCAKDSNSNSNS